MTTEAGLTRRDLLKRSVIAGGIAWVAPTILASPAGATPDCSTCPGGSVFWLKHSAVPGACETPGANPAPGNCAASFTMNLSATPRPGCCLLGGLITFTRNSPTKHTYLLARGVTFCYGFAKCGPTCFSMFDPQVNEVDNPDGTTTVTMECSSLSHSEIVVCVQGTALPAACN